MTKYRVIRIWADVVVGEFDSLELALLFFYGIYKLNSDRLDPWYEYNVVEYNYDRRITEFVYNTVDNQLAAAIENWG